MYDFNGICEDGVGKHSKVFPVGQKTRFQSVIEFGDFGKYTIFKAEIVNCQDSKKSNIMQVFAIKITPEN